MSGRRIFELRVMPCLLLLTFLGTPLKGYCATSPSSHGGSRKRPGNYTFPALMVSDIHFDPFHDPAQAKQLVSAPVGRWTAILSAPPSPHQRQAFTQLQQTCHARGVDTSYTLLLSSLRAMQSRQANAKFMTVSGDLIAHVFQCRYSTLFPGSTQSDYENFVLKTISFVLAEVRASFPNIPIYAALGNNDTPCGDYRLDEDSGFLDRIGEVVVEGLPPSDWKPETKEFSKDGSYSVIMAAPMRNTRLIVLDDLFLSREYHTCAGASGVASGDVDLTWLQNKLEHARRSGQRVWVLGHIPTGIDPYSTAIRFRNICGKGAPVMFLSSSKLADLLVEYSDIIRLGIFAHTHMDEMRLLEPEGDARDALKPGVAMKLIPSISPVDGNDPSFTVAHVDPASSILQDYEVISASNHTGFATKWSREYDYRQTYHETQFSQLAIKSLITNFQHDPEAKNDASRQYILHYYIGDRSPELKPFWPQYTCAMSHYAAGAYADCVCSAK